MNRKVLAFCAVFMLAASGLVRSDDPPPLRPENAPVERVQKRLIQVDVTAEGANRRELVPSDFEVVVGGREITEFSVDNLCRDDRLGATNRSIATPASLVFYFDQLQLSPAGRVRAFALAREVVPKALVNGNRAMVISNADRLKIAQGWTSDPTVVAAALDALEADPLQSDDAVALESILRAQLKQMIDSEVAGSREGNSSKTPARSRAPGTGGYQNPNKPKTRAGGGTRDSGGRGIPALSDLPGELTADSGGRGMRAVGAGEVGASLETAFGEDAAMKRSAIAAKASVKLARDFKRDEMDRAATSAERLAAVLARLAEVQSPKAVIYFADAFRKNAGDHYFALFEESPHGRRLARTATSNGIPLESRNAHGIDHVIAPLIHEAAAKEVKFFTVQAEGLVETTARMLDAQSTLSAMSLETGGEAFLNGVPATTIAARLLGTLSCAYLVSFDPRGLREDRALALTVSVRRPGVTVRARGTVVVESESRREVSSLIAAALGETGDGPPLRVGLVPLGWEKGRYSALVQIGAPASGPTQDWELGATLTTAGRIVTTPPQRVTAAAAVPVVLEDVVEFSPGPYDMVGLGREHAGNRTTSSAASGIWPDPNDALASISPIALVQPANGIFVRGEENKRRGFIVVPEGQPVAAESPLAAVTLVCRSGDGPRALRVRREIVGETQVPFPETEVDLKTERCAQIRDVVPESTLAGGRFVYRVEVLEGEQSLTQAERSFEVALD